MPHRIVRGSTLPHPAGMKSHICVVDDHLAGMTRRLPAAERIRDRVPRTERRMSRASRTSASYDVTVKGEVGPAVCAGLHKQCSVVTSHSRRLIVRCPSGYDLVTLHELLEGRGLTIISIRPVRSPTGS